MDLVVNRPKAIKLFPENASDGFVAKVSPGGKVSPQKISASNGKQITGLLKQDRSSYERLRDLVYTSPFIDPEYVISKLPQNALLEIRALMLERLGRHREALILYIHGLHSLSLVEAYCDRVYATAPGKTGARPNSHDSKSSSWNQDSGNIYTVALEVKHSVRRI